MSDSSNVNDPNLEGVVKRFLSAEEALIDLRSQQQRLLDATTKYNAADADLRDRTNKALDALEDARARLRKQMESAEEISKDTSGLHRSLASATDEIGQVLQTLRQIDPAGMTRNIAELRRDGADQAVETREVRRLIAEVQRTHDQLVVGHTLLLGTHNDAVRRLRLLAPTTVAVLLVSVVALVLSVVR